MVITTPGADYTSLKSFGTAQDFGANLVTSMDRSFLLKKGKPLTDEVRDGSINTSLMWLASILQTHPGTALRMDQLQLRDANPGCPTCKPTPGPLAVNHFMQGILVWHKTSMSLVAVATSTNHSPLLASGDLITSSVPMPCLQ